MIDNFKGLYIPREIMLCTALNLIEKNLVAQIDALNKKGKGCTAGNEYFAELFGLSEVRVRHIIGNLIKKGCLKLVKNDRNKALLFDWEWSELTRKVVENDQKLVKNDQHTYMKANRKQIESKRRDQEKIDETANALAEDGKCQEQVGQMQDTLNTEKKEKEKNSAQKEKEITYPFPDSRAFMEAWESWLALRRRKRWVTDSTWQQGALARLDQKAGHDETALIEALRDATAFGWQSAHPEKYLKKNQSNEQPKYSREKFEAALNAAYPNG